MEDNKYLPLGSVVLLNGGKKKVMITGFCIEAKETPDKIYDYCGCVYPEGVIRSDLTCVFDHSQIKQIFFKGYVNDEAIDFSKKLTEVKTKTDTGDSETSEDLDIERL
jgi:hypothetical protein